MNVAPTNATPPSPSIKGDPTAAANTTTRMIPDGTGTDLPIDAMPDDTFGRLLSRGMTDLAEVLQGKPVRVPSLPVDAEPPVDDGSVDPSIVRTGSTDRSRRSMVVTDLVDARAGSRASKAADDGTDDTVGCDDSAASDLAAQLALVSQWASIAPPASSATKGGDALDIKDKLATVRGAAGSTSRTVPSSASARVAPEARVDPSLPFAADAGTVSGIDARRADPGTAASAEGKTESNTRHGFSAASTSLEAGLPVEPGSARTPTEPAIAPGAAIAQQIAAATPAFASSSPADVAAVPTWNIHGQVGTPAWSREVGQATLRIATSDLQTASLQINPEHLGPVDVQVRIDNGIAHLSFDAAHADTRQAIEASRATLDRMFAEQGLKIGDCAVGDSSTSRRNADADAALAGQSQRNGGRWDQAAERGSAGDARTATTTITTRLKALGLVDTFA